jgi:hypothetical protein
MVPSPPTATNILLAKRTLYRVTEVGGARTVQCIPSADAVTVPFSPTATKEPLPLEEKVTLFSEKEVAADCGCQVAPLDDVSIVPEAPTATKRLLPKVTDSRRFPIRTGAALWNHVSGGPAEAMPGKISRKKVNRSAREQKISVCVFPAPSIVGLLPRGAKSSKILLHPYG